MKPIALLGDSWAGGPAPGQPNLGDSLQALGIPVHNFALQLKTMTTQDVLNVVSNFVKSGGDGSQFSMVLLSVGGHDMMNGVPEQTSVSNLIQIGALCKQVGLKCEVIGFPQIVMDANYATFPTLNKDASWYDKAAMSESNLQILHGAVCDVLKNFPAYENTQYSQYIPHSHQAGADHFALELVGIYNTLNGN